MRAATPTSALAETEYAVVVRAIKAFADTLFVAAVRDARWAGWARRRAPELGLLLSEACSRAGISPDVFAAHLAREHALAELLEASIRDVALGPNDPGPYDRVSARDRPGSSENYQEAPSAWGEVLVEDDDA